MSYISKPGSRVAHIFDRAKPATLADGEHRALWAKCPAYFVDPHLTAYFVGLDKRRVCKHCARVARREALALLNAAAGTFR